MLVAGETPEVVIDRSVLEANITRMAAATDAAGIGLRPHVKTHKVVEIARMQLAAGAVGLTVATVGEAEVFVDGGASDVFIAYPLWVTPAMAHRLASLAERAHLTVGVDSAEGAANLIERLGSSARSVEAWVEIDSGHQRSGVLRGSRELQQLAAHPGLQLTGVFTFPGHAYAPGQAVTAAAQEADALSEAAAVLREAGHDIRHASGGSSPSAEFSSPEHVTEVRPGVYAFADAQQYELGRCAWDSIALTVAATVVSRRSHPTRQVIVNAGSKVLGSDRPSWVSGHGRIVGAPDARISALSEHHGTVDWPKGRPMPTLGEQVRIVPNHVCITMNLVDEVAVVQDGHLIDRWPVAARGRNS